MGTFIVAEMSANHGGKIETALETVHAVKESGADAIKIQTYTADTITLNCDEPDFVVAPGGLWSGRKLHELYNEAYTPLGMASGHIRGSPEDWVAVFFYSF